MEQKAAPAWREAKILQTMVTKYQLPPPDESVQTKDITVGDFWLRLYTPPGSTNTNTADKPVGVYIHGGGWAMGSVDQEDAICRLISKHHGMTLVSVSYRLAPEYKYPTALDDCVDAASWAVSNLHASSVVLIGASAGGNLAFGVALKLIDQGHGEQIAGVVALVPVTVHPDAVPEPERGRYSSYDENANSTVNTASAMRTFFDAYGAPADDTYTSCLLHPRVKELKKVYMAECGLDTLRDDARLMQRALEQLRVHLSYDAYPGFPHYSWTFPSKLLDQHREEFLGRMLDGVRWVAGL
ncbi:Alpha/Beta hydrolase protein [Aspergillus egyptiacus]|nr:Alpha/Beta hydrolase protein [Aspergillus egyptiacus]